jgi:hypothetical protein
VFGKSIDEIVRLMKLYDQFPEQYRSAKPTAGIEDIRGVYEKIKERVRSYLTYLTTR